MSYVCDCGKAFDNPQRFNGHKTHCVEHLKAAGKFAAYLEANIRRGLGARKTLCEKHSAKAAALEEQWISERHTCERCGCVMTALYGAGRFCSAACAHSRVRTEETKSKISESVRTSKKYLGYLQKFDKTSLPEEYCKLCGKHLTSKTKYGYCQSCFQHSSECFPIRSQISINTRDQLRAANKPFGFQSRNIVSYPEKFWMQVLKNNDIDFVHEYRVTNDHGCCYFLDFLIKKGATFLDLEIDGAQHLRPANMQSDVRRDEFLKDSGYIVYRIPWNEINSDAGKFAMHSKIEEFLTFYNSLS